ncbi:hypothetical protein UlMin_004131 [Ulmus minor]
MENQSEDPAMPTAQSITNAFIQQYYVILHKSPDMVYKFYCEPSVHVRFRSDGAMTMITSLQDINDKIMSLDYQSYHTKILTVDAQGSYKGGVFVLVTGIFEYCCCTTVPSQITYAEVDNGNGNVVPQLEVVVPKENGHAGVNDLAVENGLAMENNLAKENGLVEDNGHAEENGPVENLVASSQNAPPATKETPSDLHKDVPKNSFALVVNALNKNNAPFQVRALRAPAPKPKYVEQPKAPLIHAVPEAPAPSSNRVPEKNEHRAKAYAIFVGNLPMNTTCEDLENLFKQFGPIKNDDGIQVRSSKVRDMFGFVEFESATSMQSALELSKSFYVMQYLTSNILPQASPIMFGNRRLSIEVRQGNNKFSSRKNGYRNDSFKGRMNYNGGNRGRNEFEKRGKKVTRYVISSM